VTAGSNFSFTIAASNRGPAAVNSVTLTNFFPAKCDLVSASASSGTLTSLSNRVILNWTSLNPGAAASLELTLRPTNAADLVLTNVAVIAGTTADPFPSDNQSISAFVAFADNDRDGLSDTWETAFFNSTNAPNGGPADDFDGDGLFNLPEYLQGTDPTDSSNALRIKIAAPNATNVVLRFHGVAGRQYQLEQSPTVLGPWSGTDPVITGQGFGIVTTNHLLPPYPRFYRLRQLP
jgi:uncharacterized repeat protein (TIGR01451 family)